MKKGLLFLLLIVSFGIVFAVPELTISAVSVSDTSVYAGDSGNIGFTITNTGDRDITNTDVVLASSLSVGDSTFSFSTINVGESRYITTSFSVPSGISSGSYSISISVDYSYSSFEYTDQAGATITVLPTNYLVINEYTPSLVVDELSPFVLNLSNQGTDKLENILIDLVLPDGFISTTGSQFYIDSLDVGETLLWTSNIYIEKSIEPDSFQFSLIKTASGYSDTDTLNVFVVGEPNIAFSGVNLDPDIPVSNSLQTISVQFENIGSGDAYAVVAELILDQEVTGITTEYLGTLERGDLTSAIFDIYMPTTNNFVGSVLVTYNDAHGVEHNVSQAIDVDVLTVESTSIVTYFIWLVIIVVVGYFVYNHYKKKK